MQVKSQYKLVVIAALVSLACAVGYDYLPEKRLLLYPGEPLESYSWTDANKGGSTQVNIISQSPLHWQCDVRKGNSPYTMCGAGMLTLLEGSGVDVSPYSFLTIKLKVNSSDELMRVAFSSWLGEFSEKNGGTWQFNQLTVPMKELEKGITLDLRKFSTAEWWLNQFAPPAQYTAPYLKEVRALSFENGVPPKLGLHEFEVERVELHGRFISSGTLFRAMLLFWMALLIPYAVYRYVELQKRLARERQQMERLAHYSNQLKSESEKFRELSVYDPLTGALNRNGFSEALAELTRDLTDNQQVGLIIIDLDHFKRINDQRGHDAGDEVLRSVAAVLRTNIRSSDRLARWGGEEFVVLCPHIPEPGAFALAEKLRSAVSAITFSLQPPLKVTASLGVGCFKIDEPFEQVFKRVDDALYQAKHAGRNCTIIADSRE